MTVHRAVPPSTLLSLLVLSAAVASLRCGPIQPGAVAGIEVANALACTGLTALAGGAFACQGEEAALAAALQADEAQPQAAAPLVVADAGPAVSHVAVTRQTATGRKLVGYVPARLAASCQARLNGKDGGS